MNYLEFIKTTNCSSIFLTQCIGLTAQNKIDYNFVSSYLEDETKNYEKNHIFIVFNPKDKLKFKNFSDNERWKNKDFKEHYSIGDFEVLVYALPEKYKDDYEKFKAGMYSKFSDEFKQFHPKMVKKTIDFLRKDEINISYLIINKDKSIKDYWENLLNADLDGEVWTIPNMEREKLKSYEFVTTGIN